MDSEVKEYIESQLSPVKEAMLQLADRMDNFVTERNTNRYVLDTSSILDREFYKILKWKFNGIEIIIPKVVMNEITLIATGNAKAPRVKQAAQKALSLVWKLSLRRGLSITFPESSIYKHEDTSVDQIIEFITKLWNATVVTEDSDLAGALSTQGYHVLSTAQFMTKLKKESQRRE